MTTQRRPLGRSSRPTGAILRKLEAERSNDAAILDLRSEAPNILLNPPEVGESERTAVLRALDSGWIAPAGAELQAFQTELAELVGAERALAVNSGTAALHLALLVAGVQPGDEVVVQTATFAASAFAVHHAGAVPVFCDTEPHTGMMDPELLAGFLDQRARLGRLPAAVMPVDLYGYCADYNSLRLICDRYGIPIVQDSAEALGARSQNRAAGTHGLLGVFSFNGNKIITTSGGGAVIGPSHLLQRAAKLATQAREPIAQHYEHTEIGHNFAMSNVLAALGRAQLARLGDRIAAKERVTALYRERLPQLEWMNAGVTEAPNHWLNVGALPHGADPHQFVTALAAQGIEARRSWKPMHLQPVFADNLVLGGRNAEDVFSRGICLPSGPSLTTTDIERIADAVEHALTQSGVSSVK